MKVYWKFLITMLFVIVISISASAEDVFIAAPMTNFQPSHDGLSFNLQKILIPNKGFAKGKFAWNATRNSWDLSDSFTMETPSLYARIELWKNYWENPTPVSEKITIWVGGFGVTGVSFVSPKGVTYTNCTANGTFDGMKMFVCEEAQLPVGQTEFTSGKYIIKYNVTGYASPVTRTYFLSGSYPLQFNITYPAMNAVNIPRRFTVKWNAVGAGFYDFCVYNATTGDAVYGTSIVNSSATSLSYTIPTGILAPNTKYKITIETLAPAVNGGHKGIKKSVRFTTGN